MAARHVSVNPYNILCAHGFIWRNESLRARIYRQRNVKKKTANDNDEKLCEFHYGVQFLLFLLY